MKKLVLIVIFLISLYAIYSSQDDAEYNDSFKPVDNPAELMTSEFEKGKAENKKVLIILGGNWCHDSRSLASKLDNETLSKKINANYRLSMIDVGFLNQGFEFAEMAGMKTYYATPTVLIFDPQTKQQINADDMHIWATADSVSQETTNAYFEKYSLAVTDKIPEKLSDEQQLKLQQLEQFIITQEQRIKASYKITGPMLERYKADDEDDNFEAYWTALADLRTNLPKDIKIIRGKILAASDNELAAIDFPEYAALPWE